jgi:hypothetical protein
VLSRKPRTFWALSNGIPSRNYPLTDNPDSLFATAQRAGARYVVVDHLDRLSQAYLLPVIVRHPQSFCVLYALGPNRAAMLGIRPAADTARAPAQAATFDVCGVEYWRNPQMREQLLRSR